MKILFILLFIIIFIQLQRSVDTKFREGLSNSIRECKNSKNGEVWCYGKSRNITGNQICDHEPDHKGPYYPLTKEVADDLYPGAIFRDKTDCATNYFTYGNKAPNGAINSSSMKCWDNTKKWARDGVSKNGAHIVRCTNLEKKGSNKKPKMVPSNSAKCWQIENGEVWCHEPEGSFGKMTGNEICERSEKYAGKYYPLSKKSAEELFPNATIEKKRDCATNYFTNENKNSIYSSNMTCWDDEKRWNRKKSPIVRCTNKETKEEEPAPPAPLLSPKEKEEEEKLVQEESVKLNQISKKIQYCEEMDGVLCKKCLAGYKLDSNQKVCSPNKVQNCTQQDELLCEKCEEGYKLTQNKKLCLAIPITHCKKQKDTECLKCMSPYKGAKCDECEEGYVYENNKCQKSDEIPPQKINIIPNKCKNIKCPAGSSKKEGFTNRSLGCAINFPKLKIGSLL